MLKLHNNSKDNAINSATIPPSHPYHTLNTPSTAKPSSEYKPIGQIENKRAIKLLQEIEKDPSMQTVDTDCSADQKSSNDSKSSAKHEVSEKETSNEATAKLVASGQNQSFRKERPQSNRKRASPNLAPVQTPAQPGDASVGDQAQAKDESKPRVRPPPPPRIPISQSQANLKANDPSSKLASAASFFAPLNRNASQPRNIARLSSSVSSVQVPSLASADLSDAENGLGSALPRRGVRPTPPPRQPIVSANRNSRPASTGHNSSFFRSFSIRIPSVQDVISLMDKSGNSNNQDAQSSKATSISAGQNDDYGRYPTNTSHLSRLASLQVVQRSYTTNLDDENLLAISEEYSGGFEKDCGPTLDNPILSYKHALFVKAYNHAGDISRNEDNELIYQEHSLLCDFGSYDDPITSLYDYSDHPNSIDSLMDDSVLKAYGVGITLWFKLLVYITLHILYYTLTYILLII
jgi:hypothetical protein